MSFIYLKLKQYRYRFRYVSSTKSKFMYRINNYKPTHRKFQKKCVEKDMTIVIKKNSYNRNFLTNTIIQKVTK